MQQTSKYQFNLVEGSDDFSPAPLNQNMEKVEEELEGIAESLATVMESVDGHKIAVGSYRGSGGMKNVNIGFKPVMVIIVNQFLQATSNYLCGMAVTGEAVKNNVLTITETGFKVVHGANASMNNTLYDYNYFAVS